MTQEQYYWFVRRPQLLRQCSLAGAARKDSVVQLRKYLYEAYLDGFEEHYDGEIPGVDGVLQLPRSFACSEVRKGDFQGRNFDFLYDTNSTYVMHIAKTTKNKAILGLVRNHLGDNADLKVLPNLIVDGINEDGLYVGINVVSKKDLDALGPGYENKNGTNPGGRDVHTVCVPCMLLAEADSAVNAVKLMQSVNMYGDLVGLEHVHFMISDLEDTFVVEIIGDNVYVQGFDMNVHHIDGELHQGLPIMTNWY